MKKVSIIIPCYNSTKYLEECLESLEEQTIGIDALEIILVNDASTDGTWKMIAEFERKHPQSVVAIDLQENHRQGGARNAGLQHATGKYIAFLDSDDYIVPQAYEWLYKYATENDLDMVQFNHHNFFDGWQELCDNCKLEGVLDIEDKETRRLVLISEMYTMGCWNKLYRRRMIEESGAAYAENCIYEEPLFVYPQLFYAKRVGSVRNSFYRIRMNEGSTMHRDAKNAACLIDHPKVQLLLLDFLSKYPNIMKDYYEEIEYYFLITYYIETLYISGKWNLLLGIEDFRKMQYTVKEKLPDWRHNRYLQGDVQKRILQILETCDKNYSEGEVKNLCQWVVNII